MKKLLESCSGSFCKGIDVGFTKKSALCPKCRKLISKRADGTLRNHGKKI